MRNMTTLITLAALILLAPATTNAQKKSIFEQIGDLFQAAPEVERAAVPEPINPANNANKEARRRRLSVHANAMISWIDSHCDLNEKQKEAITTSLANAIDTSQQGWLRQPNRGFQNGDRDFGPIGFVKVARSLSEKKVVQREIQAVLDDGQKAKFQAAMQVRNNAIRAGILGMGIMVLDRELFLLPEQREPLGKEIATMFGDRLYQGLFGFTRSTWPFERMAFSGQRQSLHELLGEARHRRLKRLTNTKNNGDQFVFVQMGNGDGERAFNDAIDAQPERIAEAMAVRIEYLRQTKKISKKDLRRLEIASKGAAKRAIQNWVTSSEKQMQSMRERFAGQQVSWGMSLPRIDTVERNKLWQKTLSSVLGEETVKPSDSAMTAAHARSQIKDILDGLFDVPIATKKKETKPKTEREQFQRAAMVDYAVAMLDQELWLRAEQHKKLRVLVEDALADYKEYKLYGDYYVELQILADPLAVIPRACVMKILDESQQAAWKLLRSEFGLVETPGRMIAVKYNHGDLQFPLIAKQQRRKLAEWPSEKDD